MSRNTARPCDVAWVRSVVQQCRAAGTAVFCKQFGSRPRIEPAEVRRMGDGGMTVDDEGWIHLRDRKGGDPDEWPEDLRVREMPGPTSDKEGQLRSDARSALGYSTDKPGDR